MRELGGCLEETGNKVYTYHVQCHPGKSITQLKNEFPNSLDQDDVMILVGGTNDVFRTPWIQIEQYLFSFLKEYCTKVNIVIPSRYTL